MFCPLQLLDVTLSKARLFSKIGSWTEALSVYDEVLKLPKISVRTTWLIIASLVFNQP